MKKKTFLGAVTLVVVVGTALCVNGATVSTYINNLTNVAELPQQTAFTVQTPPVTSVSDKEILKLKVDMPTKAPSLNDYLAEVITEEEKELYYYWADNSQNVVSIANRSTTEDEDKRVLVLRDKYTYDGARPQQPMPLKPGEYELYFDIKNDIYYYPSRILTDEEILQIIDQNERLNYVLSLRNPISFSAPLADELSKDDALMTASESVKKLFDADTSLLESEAAYADEESGDMDNYWFIVFKPYKENTLMAKGETYWWYAVTVDSKTGVVLDTTAFCSTAKHNSLPTGEIKTIEADDSWITRAKSVVTDKLNETRLIKSATIDLSGKEAGGVNSIIPTNAERGIVGVVITLEDNSYYTVELRYPNQELRCVTYTTTQD